MEHTSCQGHTPIEIRETGKIVVTLLLLLLLPRRPSFRLTDLSGLTQTYTKVMISKTKKTCKWTAGRRKLADTKDCMLPGYLTSQQHASVSQGRICLNFCTWRHTDTEVADQACDLIQSQYTGTEPTSPRTDSTPPGTWQGSHYNNIYQATGTTPQGKVGLDPCVYCCQGRHLTTCPPWP